MVELEKRLLHRGTDSDQVIKLRLENAKKEVLRKDDYDFRKIYERSNVFNNLRRVDDLKGKCGICEYRRVCGGCRARAYVHDGDYMSEEPSCAYTPRGFKVDR